MRWHIVTGASKGLGRGLVHALRQAGDHVAAISRSAGDPIEGVRYYAHDFASTESLTPLFARIFSDFKWQDYESISLVNNAGAVEPIAQIEKIPSEDILRSLLINLYSPMALTGEFLRRSSAFRGERTIVNVSSGAARRPKPSWATYSAAKAGLEAFSQAVDQEKDESSKLRLVTFDPGVMDTEMQGVIRGVDPQDFPGIERFLKLKTDNELRSPEIVGHALSQVLLGKYQTQSSHLSVSELLK